MKKRQLIATLSCLLVGMVGFAGAYALDQSAEIEEQQEAEAPSSELLSQASGTVEPETDQDSEETGGESQETGSSLAKTDAAADGSEGSSDTVSTAAILWQNHQAQEIRQIQRMRQMKRVAETAKKLMVKIRMEKIPLQRLPRTATHCILPRSCAGRWMREA